VLSEFLIYHYKLYIVVFINIIFGVMRYCLIVGSVFKSAVADMIFQVWIVFHLFLSLKESLCL